MSYRRALSIVAIATAAAGGTGCTVHAVAPPPPTFVGEVYYRPLSYRGHVVYYDDFGQPIYFVRGLRYYVPPSHRHYRTYVRHYRRNRPAYNRWAQRHHPRVVRERRSAPVIRRR